MALHQRSDRRRLAPRRTPRSLRPLLENLEFRLVLSKSAIATEPPPSVVQGDIFGIVAAAEDSSGKPDASYSGNATLSLVSGPAPASFNPVTIPVTDGLAVFSGLSLGQLSSGTDYVFQVAMDGLNTVTTEPVDVVAPTPGVSNYYPLPVDSDIRGDILSADFDGDPTSVVTLSVSSLHYDITSGELALFNGASGSKTISINGQGSSDSVIDAGGTSRVFEVIGDSSLHVDFQDLAIEGGNATDGGFLKKSAAVGGGVLIDGGSVAMTNVGIMNDLAVGAVGNGGNGGNAQGGGISLAGGSLTMTDDIIQGNIARGGTGGNGGMGFGGGLYVSSGALTVENSTIADNSLADGADGTGGAMFIQSGSATLYNATVALNQSGIVQVGGTFTAYNSLFAQNGYSGSAIGPTGADFSDSLNGNGRAIAHDSLFQSDPGGLGIEQGGGSFVGNAGLDPRGLRANGGPTETIALVAGSNAIGAGQDGLKGVTLLTDQRGYLPAPGSGWDIGAYQYGATPAVAPTVTLSSSNVGVSGYGQTTYTFSIVYTDDVDIMPSSLTGAVVQVVPPAGLGGPITATVSSIVVDGPTDPWGDARSFTVTYTVVPPGGKWTSADNGTYAITLGGSPVGDTQGNTFPTGPLGNFRVETALIGYSRTGVVYRRTGASTYNATTTITLTNDGSSAFSGPLYIVLSSITAGYRVANPTGTYGGDPYVEVNIGNLAPGQSISLTISFTTTTPGAILNYIPIFYLGALGL